MGKMLFLLFSESFENELDALSLWIYTPHSRAHTHTRTCGHIGHWTQIQITHICMSNRMKEKMIFLLAASNDTHIHTHTPIHAYSRTEHKSISFSFFFSSCNSLLKFLLWDTFEKYAYGFFFINWNSAKTNENAWILFFFRWMNSRLSVCAEFSFSYLR